SMHDEPTRNARAEPRFDAGITQRNPVVAPAPRPAAAPALPQPALARAAVPAAREPAARPIAKRPSGTADDRRSSGAPMLRDGAIPPQYPAPQPPERTATSIEYAAGWRLFLSHAVDFALLSLFFVLIAKLDAAIAGPKNIETSGVFDWIGSHPGSTLRAAILTTLVGTAYHIVTAQLSGRTLGRFVAGTTLARRSGKPLNTFVIVVRAVASFVSLLLFGAGFFWSIVDRRGRGLHDLVAGTMVVRYHG
ncbi:MAG TPA: RDD family protein, partial [Myxococcota bacterium]|nr:RDD family protein [Myxococcota bacterium]